MRLEDLEDLVAKGEFENLEFKRTTGQRTEAAKTVCAMLNGLGGFVLFGLSDKGEIVGQHVSAKTLEDISQELSKIEPPAFPEIETLSINKDNREYWGNAFNLLKRAEGFLLNHVPISGRVVPGKIVREDYPLYPPLAVREALANSICHRDYITPGGAVAIAMYDDRMEVVNPGVLHFGITPEKLSRPHESKPWNPIIANVFYRAGIIEKWGTGTLNIIDWCKENGNPRPTWEVRAESVITTFLPSVFFAMGKIPEEWEDTRPESMEGQILDLLRNGPLSKGEISLKLGHTHISGGVKKALFSLLKQEDIIFTIPERPNSRLQKYKLKEVRVEKRPESRPESIRKKAQDKA